MTRTVIKHGYWLPESAILGIKLLAEDTGKGESELVRIALDNLLAGKYSLTITNTNATEIFEPANVSIMRISDLLSMSH